MTYVDTRHVSALLKRQLTDAFPGVKFSVRSRALTLSVFWTDGPDDSDVMELAELMKGSSWNSFEKLYESAGNTVTVTVGGETITGTPHVHHLNLHRDRSDEAMAEARALWLAAHGGEEPAGMAPAFMCEGEWIREQYGPQQLLEVANLVVLPRRWKAAQAAAPAKKTRTTAPAPKPASAPAEGLAIAHTEEGGITVTGTRRGDGAAEILKAAGFRWYRKGGSWYVPGTRTADGAARLDEVRATLQQAGMVFADEQPADAPAEEQPVTAELVEEEPAELAPAEEPVTAELVEADEEPADAEPRTAPGPRRSAKEAAVLREVGDFIKDAPGIGAHTITAARNAIVREIRSGMLRADHLTGSLVASTAAITAKVTAELRANGLTHEEIRQRFETKRAEAHQAGDIKRYRVAGAMVAAHAGIVADEQARERAALAAQPRELEPPAPAELPAPPADEPKPAVPVARPGLDAGAHRIVNTGESVPGGTAYAFRCLNDCGQEATLADFGGLRCTDLAELEHARQRAHRLLDDVTLRDAKTLEVNDGDMVSRLPRPTVEAYLTRILRDGAEHRWCNGLRLTRNGVPVATIQAAPDPAPAPARAAITYRRVPVPAFIAEGWEGDRGEAWRSGVDAALTYAVLAQASTP